MDDMFEDVKDIAKTAKKKLGKNGWYALLAVLGLAGVYILTRGRSNGSDVYVPATGYASYPDAPENADTIIDTINKEISGASDSIIGSITTSESEIIENQDDLKKYMQDYTADYIKDAEAANKLLKDKVEDTIIDAQRPTVGYTMTDTERQQITDTVRSQRDTSDARTAASSGSTSAFTSKGVSAPSSGSTSAFTSKGVSAPSSGSTSAFTSKGVSAPSSGSTSRHETPIVNGNTSTAGTSSIGSGSTSGRSSSSSSHRTTSHFSGGFSGFGGGRRH